MENKYCVTLKLKNGKTEHKTVVGYAKMMNFFVSQKKSGAVEKITYRQKYSKTTITFDSW